MSAHDLSRPLAILRSLYQHVKTLEEFADNILFKEGQRAVLIESSDTNLFATFARGVFVCFDKELQQVPSCNQICTLPELLAFVLNSLKRKRKKNVLAHGYKLHSLAPEERDADQLKFQGDVTQSAAYIHGSDLWKKVILRLGTDITRYLFECCSVFVAVPPSCLFQICGAPIYDRLSTTASCGRFYVQRWPKTSAKSQFRRHRHEWRWNKRLAAQNAATTKEKRKRSRSVKVNAGKRKREPDDNKDETTAGSRGRKRARVQEVDQEVQQVSDELQSVAKTSESSLPGRKRPTRTHTKVNSIEGGHSCRAETFPPLPASLSVIRTMRLMYGGKGMQGFLLNRKKKRGDVSSRLQGRDLLRIVFFEGLPYLSGLERKPRRLPRRFFNMLPLFSQLLDKHRRCSYSRILQRTCPLRGGEEQGDISSLLPQHCRRDRVYLFVKECLTTVVPDPLWGSAHNRSVFFARVRAFLSSGKLEKMSVSTLMWKVKVNDCDWLKISKAGRCPPSELSYRTQILARFLSWLLDSLVIGFVHSCFFVTESVGQKYGMRFYRQEVWAKLHDLAFRNHLSKGQMEELSPARVASLPKSTVTARIRFIPKADAMRPITRVIGADAKTRLYHSRLRDMLDILRACVRSRPNLLGSTVWGLTDIHRVLGPVALTQKDQPQPLYFVKVDVSGAYESLPHSKLLEVVSEALSPFMHEPCTIRRYARIWSDAHEGLKWAFVRQADFLDGNMGSSNMKAFVASLQKKGMVHHSILVEQHFGSDICGKEALQFFSQMLTGSIAQFGKKLYRQCRGIPQGSVVSSLLCCLCYGHMENALFTGITKKNSSCLIRLVDDFLLITPDLHDAQTFLNTLLAGVPQYGLAVHPQKVVVNFKLSSTASLPDIRMLPPHCLFPWCGLLLDTHSLDIYKDYSSFAGLSVRYSLSLGSLHCAGQQMKRKLMSILRLKCHAVFVDLKSNSVEAVYKNVYKLLLLHALRFHVCAQTLPFGQTVAKNPQYFLQMIWDLAQYANHLIRLSNKGQVLGTKAQSGVMQYEAVELLLCLSYLPVLSKHRALYRELLPHLHHRKRSLERRLGDLRLARVRQATNPRIPDDFLAIQN